MASPREEPPAEPAAPAGVRLRCGRRTCALAAVALAAAAADAPARASGFLGWTFGAPALDPGTLAWTAAAACAVRAWLDGDAARTRGPLRAAVDVALRLALGVAWVLAAALLLELEVPRRRAVAAALAAALVVEGSMWLGARRPRAAALVLLGLGAGALSLQHLSRSAPLRDGPQARGGTGAPIVLVTLDTTRRDTLGCYGAGEGRTPHLDAFAARATRYGRAVTPSPHTHPAMASLLTGAPPLEHGSLAGAPFLDRSHATLAEHCSAHGYATAGFLDNPWLHGGFGLERGYAYVESSARPERIERWLDRRGGGPFLLHVHFFHAHGPYDAARAEAAAFAPPGAAAELVGEHVAARTIRAGEVPLHHGFAPADVDWMRAMQAAEVRRMDEDFGALVAALEARGLFDRAVVVVASDHGEEFGERGGLHHSHTLFGELVDVPLLVRAPGRAAGVDARPISLVDVHALVTHAAGLPPLADARALDSASAQTPLVSVRVRQCGRHLLRATDGRFALHVRVTPGAASPERALYDLALDPAETTDVLASHPGIAEGLFGSERVQSALAALRALDERPVSRSAGAEVRADLRALGYAR
ncbi:MAG: sulfatase [Planctomycetota bacterium]